MKVIDLEAHFFTEEYLEYLRARREVPRLETVEDERHEKFEQLSYGPGLHLPHRVTLKYLLDLGEGRMREMDAVGIDMQVLSLSNPGPEAFEDPSEATAIAKKINDELSNIIRKYPERFIGLAALAPQVPDVAADELERAVKKLNLKGAKMNSHVRGEYLDDEKYWVIFERAEKLGVPIYLHPKLPSPQMLKPYADYGFALAGASWGFAAETSLHAMRLIYSGVFDKYPQLIIILGHLGEGLPFWLSRIDYSWLRKTHDIAMKNVRKPSDYVRNNFMMTTSGMFFQPAFMCAYLALGADRLLFAVDYPYEANKEAVQFMEAAPICDSDKEKIYHLTAENIFCLG
jgi:2,3-dihydroxybenzoate decarboxylase